MKDFIEACKLFLNVDLGSGIIRSNGEGIEFETEKGFTCRKYVGSSSKDKEILCISTKDFDIKSDLLSNYEEHFEVKVKQEQMNERKVGKEIHRKVDILNSDENSDDINFAT